MVKNPRMTFGEHLKQFALSIDFIDPSYYERVQQHIQKYLEIQLGAVQVALFERAVVDDADGMTTVWSFPTFRIHQTLREDGKYRRQLALALGETRSLWTISPTGERLSPDNPGVDVWGDKADGRLPPFYISSHAQPSLTSIILITRDARARANGAFLIEIGIPVHPTQILRREMQLLADAVGLLHATDVSTKEQREGTNKAVARLAELVPELDLDTGPRPLMFVASSSRAPADVMDAVGQVLDRFKDYVFVRHWGTMHRPGNINMQLVEEIRGAQYGVCYLSEETGETDESRPTFRDNPNVLVEAGMLHMVTRAASPTGTGWIPIREEDSPDAPFDLENQRMVLVKRDDRGNFNREEFMTDLEAKLSSLLETELRSVGNEGFAVEDGAD